MFTFPFKHADRCEKWKINTGKCSDVNGNISMEMEILEISEPYVEILEIWETLEIFIFLD